MSNVGVSYTPTFIIQPDYIAFGIFYKINSNRFNDANERYLYNEAIEFGSDHAMVVVETI